MTSTYLVECYWPLVTVDQIAEVLAGSGSERSHVPGVRSLGAIVIPSEATALLLFEADGPDLVRQEGPLAEIPFDRVVEVQLVAVERPCAAG